MTLPRTVADVLSDHVVFEVECIDRMYLNVYVPQLQYATGLVSYIHRQLGKPVASTAALAPVSEAFTRSVRAFAAGCGIPWVDFAKGQRKDDVAGEYLAAFTGTEGVLFIGRAQEKVPLFRTRKRHRADGSSYPWIAAETGVVSQFDIYAVDADFGPFFLKFCSYFPFNAKLCVNGNEWAKRQAARAGIGFTPLDSGFAAVEDVPALQAICDALGPAQIDALLRKWLARLPHPFSPADRAPADRDHHNQAMDFGIGKRLTNLPALRQIGYTANRRLLRAQRLSHDPITGAEALASTCDPVIHDDATRVAGLRLTDPRAQALLHILLIFRLHPGGFLNRDLRELLAEYLGRAPGTITAGQATYDLRRLREHGLIERISHTHRYQVTSTGLRNAMFLTRVHDRILQTGIAQLNSDVPAALRQADRACQAAIHDLTRSAGIAA